MNCKKCNTEGVLNYCPNCGHAVNLKRIDGHYIIHEVEHVLHFERGILYTVRELLFAPGKNIRNYLSDDRSRLVKPIIFVIVTSLLYSLVIYLFKVEDGYVKYGENKRSAVGVIFKWVQDHYGYANIIMGIFIAFWTRIFFKKFGYNFFEILILLCFVMGAAMLIIAVFAVIQGITKIELVQGASVLAILYCTWAIGEFFGKRSFFNYLKAFCAYILGMLTFVLLAVLIGVVAELIIRS